MKGMFHRDGQTIGYKSSQNIDVIYFTFWNKENKHGSVK